MAHFDRGVYEPGEDIRVFDGSEDEDDAEGSRLPLLIVLALLVLAMFGGLVWLAYTQGVARGRTETPVLAAQNGPARVAPANQGGAAQEPYKGFKIYEQPAPPDDDVDTTTAAATPSMQTAPATKPAPVTVAAPPKPIMAPPASSKAAVAAAPPVSTPKIAAATPAPPALKAAAPLPKLAAATPPAVVKAAPPAAKSVPAATYGPATAPPRALALTTPKPVPVTASGAYTLQIGAYKSQGDADAAWKTYKARHAALLADASDDVQQADLGDKGIWYRLRITGFPSKDVASAMCDRLKADGGICFLGK